MLFGIGKRKTVEAMLAELAAVGISPRPGIGVDDLVAPASRAKVEKAGFELLLCAMGDERFDPATNTVLDPLSDDVWHFDVEAIEDHGAYVYIVESCRRLTGGDLQFEGVRDYVDVDAGIAWVELSTNGQSQRIDLKVDNDWVDPTIFAKLAQWLHEAGSKRRFATQGLGQDLLMICKAPEQIAMINRATGLRFTEDFKI
jgi:hypothetical protein|uniref:Uncharacterized protein n=1 Tax=Rhodopseudomonas palustris (strain BisA53) TaxID=316055 RepID=Q07ND3_RHOP5